MSSRDSLSTMMHKGELQETMSHVSQWNWSDKRWSWSSGSNGQSWSSTRFVVMGFTKSGLGLLGGLVAHDIWRRRNHVMLPQIEENPNKDLLLGRSNHPVVDGALTASGVEDHCAGHEPTALEGDMTEEGMME